MDYVVVTIKPAEVVTAVKKNADVRVAEIGIPGPPGPPGIEGPSGALAFNYPAAYPISGHRAVMLNAAGELVYASAGVLANADRVLGVTLNAAAAGDVVKVQRSGEVTEPSWSWSPDSPIYLGLDGVLTQTPPAPPGSRFSLVIGVPLSPTTVFLNVGFPIVLL